MGELVRLAERRARRTHGDPVMGRAAVAVLHFDLSCPFSYLAIERAERLLGEVRWQPTLSEALHRGDPLADPLALEASRRAAERRARELRLPLIWPVRHPRAVRAGMRAALCAAEQGRGAAFALAAGRLAFCGGFELDDPEVLAEAAAAAGIGLDACLRAARDVSLDGALEAAGRRLLADGADRLPAVRVGRSVHCGERRLAEVAASLRAPSARRSRAG